MSGEFASELVDAFVGCVDGSFVRQVMVIARVLHQDLDG